MESKASKSPSTEKSRNWLELPPEVTSVILRKIGVVDILINAQRVCTSWRSICKDPSMWRSVNLQLDAGCDSRFDVEAMARNAVDRSCGQLVDISVAHFATNEFVRYLARSSSQLRRLQIVSCHRLSEDVLKETASMFPMLEELKIQSTPFSVASVEAVGRCCPQLKMFKCNASGCISLQAQHDALVDKIATSMIRLCHLQLLGIRITTTGLKALLHGCPRLETLDLGGCYSFNLEEYIERQVCFARFKEVRFLENEVLEDEDDEEEDDDDVEDYDDDEFESDDEEAEKGHGEDFETDEDEEEEDFETDDEDDYDDEEDED